MDFPAPVIEIAIEPKSKADQEKLGVALAKMVAEDPSFTVFTDQESGQTIMKGMGELHLDIKVDILKRTYKVEANIGAPQVAYRESLGRKVPTSTTPTRSRPAVRASSPASRSCSSRASRARASCSKARSSAARCRRNSSPASRRAWKSAKENGLLAGFPLIDFKATLIDGAYHDVDSSVLAFEIAARAAFRELREKGAPKLLEPIMKVEVVTPDEYLGDVIGDLNSRRGQIQGTETARQRPGRHRLRAAGQHVRLRQHPARHVARAAPSSPCTTTTTSRCRKRVADEVIKKYA